MTSQTTAQAPQGRNAFSFSVRPMGARWAIVCGGDVIAITGTEQQAAALAIKAAGALRIGRAEAPEVEGEARSFAKW
jgi:hypothetical protein